MGDLYFQPHLLSLIGMGFLTKDASTEKLKHLFAVFYYVHHGQYLPDVNNKLLKRSLRPITRSEFQDFFELHRLSIAHMEYPFFISTSPSDILVNRENDGTSLVPGIWKEEDGTLKCGNVVLNKLAGGKEYIPDHEMIVIAIDEGKSEI